MNLIDHLLHMAGTEDEKAVSHESIHTVWIHGRPAEDGSHNYCMKAFLSMKTSNKRRDTRNRPIESLFTKNI